MTQVRAYRIETDLVPGGKSAVVQVDAHGVWTLAVFEGLDGLEAAKQIAALLSAYALEVPTPSKWESGWYEGDVAHQN